jgi:murein L,D-transpeptidase YafK
MTRRKIAVLLVWATVVLLIVAGAGVWLVLRAPHDPHADVPHRPEGVAQPSVRAVPAATMKKVRERLHRALSAAGLQPRSPIFMRIFKHSRELEIWVAKGEAYTLFRSYEICTFSGDLGPKLRRGDYQAPEGFYFVKRSQLNPWSAYHLSFNVGYPNAYDRAHRRTGSAIMVHGDCVSAGCFAMRDPVIEEIFALAEDAFVGGQPFFRLHIFPFRMSEQELRGRAGSDHLPFWMNLKEGYDIFERERRPPNIEVEGKRYVFTEG